jgi:ABC-type transporter Mla maintaining outer membrane lipid asymmetry ATPase subunit MlaF
MNEDVIIEMRDVTVPSRRDSDVATIEQVNWTVKKHDFLVVGGLQGSGKSDLMFMLAGLTKPLTGKFTLYGQDMGEHFGDEFLPNRRRVGMVFDDARLLNHLTIAENVALPARYHHNLDEDESEGWTIALLKATDVMAFAPNTPSMVARHWRCRAALARALALKPEILLLENPLRGMDARHVAWWLKFLQDLWRGHDLMSNKPMTIVASTDEFRPWRNSGAQFVVLHGRKFMPVGEAAPEDDIRMITTAEEDK